MSLFCSKCGAKLEEGSAFCSECGEKVVDSQKPELNHTTAKSNEKITPGKTNTGLIIVIAAVAIILIGSLTGAGAYYFLVSKPTEVKISDYISVEYSGFDGAGTAEVTFDEELFTEDIHKILKRKWKSTSKFDEATETWALGYSISKSEKLYNDEVLALDLEYEKDVFKENKINLIDGSVECVVEGLEATTEIDPFADIEVEFEGIDGNGSISIVNNSSDSFISTMEFSVVDGSYVYSYNYLYNGDTVTIGCGVTEDEALSNGYVFTETQKDYVCEGLSEYYTAPEDFSTDDIEELKNKAEGIVSANVESELEEYVNQYPDDSYFLDYVSVDYEYQGTYFCPWISTYDSSAYANYTIIVFSATFTYEENGDTLVLYHPILVENTYKTASGVLVYTVNSDYSTYFYEDFESLQTGFTDYYIYGDYFYVVDSADDNS